MPYSPKRFFNGTPAGTGDQTLYTVPAGQTAIITQWTFSPSNGAASGYLYAGTSSHGIISFNRAPGASAPADFPANTSYMYQGFYVVHAGEPIIWGGNGNTNAWQVICGLEGSGDVAGRTPMRLGTVSPTNTADTVMFTASGGGCIIKTILVSNWSETTRQFGIRLDGAPVGDWNGTCQSQEVKQFEGNYFLPAGSQFLVNSFSAGNAIRFTAYGWQL